MYPVCVFIHTNIGVWQSLRLAPFDRLMALVSCMAQNWDFRRSRS